MDSAIRSQAAALAGRRHVARPGATRRTAVVNVDHGLLLVRLVVGLLFMAHGCQKLLGWFGGDGLAAWFGTAQRAGFQPAAVWASASIAAELGGGLLLLLGLLTPLAASLLIGDMLVAIVKVHAPKGLWSQNGGFEYPLVLIALMLAVGLIGAGRYALDRRLPRVLPRPHTFIALLVLTLAGVLVAVIPTMAGAPTGRGG